jgi:hypothetical protein
LGSLVVNIDGVDIVRDSISSGRQG